MDRERVVHYRNRVPDAVRVATYNEDSHNFEDRWVPALSGEKVLLKGGPAHYATRIEAIEVAAFIRDDCRRILQNKPDPRTVTVDRERLEVDREAARLLYTYGPTIARMLREDGDKRLAEMLEEAIEANRNLQRREAGENG